MIRFVWVTNGYFDQTRVRPGLRPCPECVCGAAPLIAIRLSRVVCAHLTSYGASLAHTHCRRAPRAGLACATVTHRCTLAAPAPARSHGRGARACVQSSCFASCCLPRALACACLRVFLAMCAFSPSKLPRAPSTTFLSALGNRST